MKHKLFLLISSLIILIFSAVTVVVVLKNRPKTPKSQNPTVTQIANQNIEELLFNENLKSKSFQPAKKTRIVLDRSLNVSSKEQIYFYDANRTPVDVPFEIIKEDGQNKIEIQTENFKPGEYTLVIDTGKQRQIAQDFSWGVLAVNTDLSVYSPGQKAEIYMTVLDKYGATACNAKVQLTVIAPSGKKTIFSTDKNTIEKSPECQPKNFTYLPDFKAIFTVPAEIGQYRLQLVSVIDDISREIEEIMLVNPEEPYVITRTTATRIYPPSEYTMKIQILAKQAFQGTIIEKVPGSFTVTPSISWSVNLKAGEVATFEYQFKAPLISPEFYLLGPLEFQQDAVLVYTESRVWHLAADPVSGIIVAWPSTAGTIPAGWSREAALDSRYLKSVLSGTNPGLTSGSTAPHTHTVTAHTHTQNSHSHTNSSGSSSEIGLYSTSGTDYQLAARYHSHTVTIDSATAANQNAAVTLDSSANEPPYYTVIWITSNGTTDIPDGAVAFGPTILTSWSLADGGGGRPDLRNKYLKGAATGADGGATGGASSHTHTNSSHNHTQNAHDHTGSTSVTGSFLYGMPGPWSVNYTADRYHAHAVTVNSATAVNVGSTVPIVSADNDPPYKKALPLINKSGTNLLTDKIIVVWTGTLASIPEGWNLCDGTGETPDLRNYFVKGAYDASENGNTGGSTTHTHTAIAHTHTQNAHGHTGSLGTSTVNVYSPDLGANDGSDKNHTHSFTIDDATATNQNTTVTVNNSADTRPPYYEVAFIQYSAPPAPNFFRFEGVKMEGLKINYNLDFWRKILDNLKQLAYIFYARKTEIIA